MARGRGTTWCLGAVAVVTALGLAACGGDPATQPGATVTGGGVRADPSPSDVSPTGPPGTEASPTGSVSVAPATTGATPPVTSSSTSASPLAPPPAGSPTCPPKGSLLGKDLERIPTDRKVVALTFDGGASADGVDEILATLAEKNVPATFFVTGDFATKNPQATKAIAARYIVGNHSTTHPDLTTKSDAQVRSEVEQAQQQIQNVTGRDPRPYFRFPFGARDARTIALVNEECYVPFRWTTDSLGWKGTSGGMSVDKVRQRVVSDLEPGGIVLMHVGKNPDDGSMLDAQALPGIIDGARAQGYDFVTLQEAVG